MAVYLYLYKSPPSLLSLMLKRSLTLVRSAFSLFRPRRFLPLLRPFSSKPVDNQNKEQITLIQRELLKAHQEDDEYITSETAARIISLRLLSVENAGQTLDLFERQFLKNPMIDKREIFGEELALVLFYAAKNVDTLKAKDGRLLLLLDMLYNRYEGLDYEYKASTLWALHILS